MTGITALRGFFNACLGVEARTSEHARRPRPGTNGREDEAWRTRTNFQSYRHTADVGEGRAARDRAPPARHHLNQESTRSAFSSTH